MSHFYTTLLPNEHTRPWGNAFHVILSHRFLGYVGIYVFFVLSGFVIARNFHQTPVTLGLVGRFALRRSIRLDPTYWTVIGLTLALEGIKSSYVIGTAKSWGMEYSGFGLLANLVYLNELLGFRPVVAAGWTLCLEIQFYLVFAFLELLHFQTSRRWPAQAAWSRCVWFAPFFFWSLLVYYLLPSGRAPTVPGLFIEYWYAFFLGVVVWWTLSGTMPWTWLYTCLLLPFLVVILAQVWPAGELITFDQHGRSAGACGALIAALAIWLLGKSERLETGLSSPLIQYLGRISYSLYLIHGLVGNRGLRLLLHFSEGVKSLSGLEVIALFWIAVALSILAAHGLYAVIERPTHRLSRKISLLPGPRPT